MSRPEKEKADGKNHIHAEGCPYLVHRLNSSMCKLAEGLMIDQTRPTLGKVNLLQIFYYIPHMFTIGIINSS